MNKIHNLKTVVIDANAFDFFYIVLLFTSLNHFEQGKHICKHKITIIRASVHEVALKYWIFQDFS